MKDEFERLLKEGFEEFYCGHWEEADELYEAARRLRPESGTPVVLEGRSRLMQGHLPEAVEKFSEALEIEPHCVQAYEAFASVFSIYGGDHVSGIHCLLYALQLKPERQHTWCLLINDLKQLKIPDIIKDATDMALKHAIDDTEADFELRCTIYKALDHREEYAEEAKRFKAMYPSNRMAEMHSLMADPSDEKDETLPEEKLEDEDIDESGWGSIIDNYMESFKIDGDAVRDIEHLWKLFQEDEVPEPERAWKSLLYETLEPPEVRA